MANIGNISIEVFLGDMTKVKADAYVVPQFRSAASYGGVGGAVARAGGKRGLDAFQKHIDENGELKFGALVRTDAGGGNSTHLLNAVSVGSGKDLEFLIVMGCVFRALEVARAYDIHTIVAPAMGTGIIGDLTDQQSAQAIFAGVEKFMEKYPHTALNFMVAIYGNPDTVATFDSVLTHGAYKNLSMKDLKGARKFDAARWQREMDADVEENVRAFGESLVD